MSSSQSSSLSNHEKNNLMGTENFKYNNCVAIRQEIQRFESVHPSIYAIYDLLELNSDQVLSLRIREHLLSIEAAILFGRRSFRMSKKRKKCVFEKLDSFVNSQEWTLSRNVPDLRLGIVGNLNSGKSAFVHRYLTGSYMQDESPEGGRFKKEVFIHNQSNMLLIRDEGGAPEMQFSCWVDAVIFVFSVDNLESFEAIREYYQKLASYRLNLDQVPLILVGTQDANSNVQRVIDEFTARRLAEEMQRDCVYYETCATYGHNVGKVFQDACQRIIQARSVFSLANCPGPSGVVNHTASYLNSSNQYHPYSSSRPSTPNNPTTPNNNYLNNNYCFNGNRQSHSPLSTFNYQSPLSGQQHTSLNSSLRKTVNTPLNNKNFGNLANNNNNQPNLPASANKAKEQHIFISPSNPVPKRLESKNTAPPSSLVDTTTPLSSTVFTPISTIKEALQQNAPKNNILPISTTIGSAQHPITKTNTPLSNNTIEKSSHKIASSNSTDTPICTPNQNRKARRRSNILFSVSSSKNKNLEEKSRNGELGSGRAIPLRQGYLHKKSVNSSLNNKLSLKNKEWKKKYVTLTTDGCLTYHSSLHDYMNDTHGKKISLMHTTVKIPAQKPRGSSIITSTSINASNTTVDSEFNRLNLLNNNQNNNNNNHISCTVNEMCIDGGNLSDRCANCGLIFSTLDRRLALNNNFSIKDKDSGKKKHRRHKSEQIKNSSLTTSVSSYCERCAIVLENGNGFAKSSESANGHEEEDFVFVIVSLDNKQWHFQAQSAEDREAWLQAIENQILLSLQNIQSDKEKLRNSNSDQSNKEKMFKDKIRQIAGNNYCLDCDAPNPTWASLNLGGLICIECSGTHRNLGTHISKVRSIDLDDWPQGNIAVMLALGNSAVNKIWEYNTKNLSKPVPTSSRDEKESWIRRKYERKEFLCPLYNQTTVSEQLESSIRNADVHKVFQILSQLSGNQTSLNEIKFNTIQRISPLQLAVSLNNIAIVQLIIWSNGINTIDASGQNALSYAKSNEMKELLKSQGCQEKSASSHSPNSSLINKSHNRNDPNSFTFRDNFSSRDNNKANRTPMSDVFDQLPTSII